MKTDLAYLDDTLDRVAKSEVSTEDAVLVKKATINIAGVECLDDNRLKNAIKGRMKSLDTYLVQRAVLKKKCEDLGVPALAVVPSRAWSILCKQAEVIQLGSVADGHVRLEIERLWDGAMREAHKAATLLCGLAVGVLLGTGVFALIMWACVYNDHYPHDAFTYFESSVLYLICAGVMAGIMGGITQDTRRFARLGFRLTWASFMGKNFKHKSMMTMIDPEGERFKFNLPPASEQVKAVLLKLRNEDLRVASVPEALEIPQLYQAMANMADRSWQVLIEARKQARQERWAAIRDPVFYLEDNGVVAIIAQYGDFPIEKELIDRVTQSDLLADNNLVAAF